jgi:hypothetical protein
MTIVPIGNLPLQVPESGQEFVCELIEHMRDLILYLRCQESLETEMEPWGVSAIDAGGVRSREKQGYIVAGAALTSVRTFSVMDTILANWPLAGGR